MKKCEGCREIAERLEQIYADVNRELLSSRDLNPSLGNQVVPVHRDLELLEEPVRAVREIPNKRFPARIFKWFGKSFDQNPVLFVFGSFLVVAVLWGVASYFVRFLSADARPAYVRLDSGNDYFQVFNEENQILWQLPGEKFTDMVRDADADGKRLYEMADLKNDGQRDVLTVLPLGASMNNWNSYFTVYDPKGHILMRPKIETDIVNFRGVQYSDSFKSSSLLVGSFDSTGQKNIFVDVQCGRSPTYIARFDEKGNLIGEYWHFGVLNAISSIRLDGGRKEYAD